MKTEVDYSQTYWNNKGKHKEFQAALAKMIPASGPVPNFPGEPEKNKALEKFRIASNCYYDLYNNGLCNRAAEFRRAFGFSATKLTARNERGLGYALSQELVDLTETRMDEIILAAYAEQFPQEKTFVGMIDCTPVGCQTPEGNARVAAAIRDFDSATAEVANLATSWIKGHAFNVLPEGQSDLQDIREAIAERESKQEAFLRAVAGK